MTGGARAEVRVVTVSQVANAIYKLISTERKFDRIGVRGEVTNSRMSAGNLYFDLKDRDALLNCVAFSEVASQLQEFTNGDQVIAYGALQAYGKRSAYQLRLYDVVPEGGYGLYHQRYLALRVRLEQEGLFLKQRRRPIPQHPFRVALVTSRQARGAEDFLVQARTRAPHVEVTIVETAVQGERAASGIARAVARAAAMPDVDIIVLVRGGGSLEDLYAFSDEQVVRAVAASAIPTVSAIGHEADEPLVDLVADFRVSTPSTAAQTILPRRTELVSGLGDSMRRLTRCVDASAARARQRTDFALLSLRGSAKEKLGRFESELFSIEKRLDRSSPFVEVERRRIRLEYLRLALTRTLNGRIRSSDGQVALLLRRLVEVSGNKRLAARREPLLGCGRQLDFSFEWFLHTRFLQLERLNDSLNRQEPGRRTQLLMLKLGQTMQRWSALVSRSVVALETYLFRCASSLSAASPAARLEAAARTITSMALALEHAAVSVGEEKGSLLDVLAAKLNALSPEAILQRGYAIVMDAQGKIIKDSGDVSIGAEIRAKFANGELVAHVESRSTDA
jgi:exodeoxyribonuclease VII large subunit